MPGITVYSTDQRQAPVTSAKQQAPSAGFGEGVGESIQRAGGALGNYAKAKDAYDARVEEAGVMELDAEFSDAAREVESGYMQLQGRNAIDQQREFGESWDKLASTYLDKTSSPRQRAMMEAQLRQRRERWTGQAVNHLTRETESWQVGVEDSSLANTVRDAATLPVGTPERMSGYLQVGARLDDIARRRGWSQEQRQATGFLTFSGIHIGTVQQLRDEDPEQALAYLEEHKDQIEPDKLPNLMTQVRDDAYTYRADNAARSFVDGIAPAETIEVEEAGVRSTVTVIPPVSASMGSRFGPRRSPGGVGSTNHRGVDYPVPVNTPVVASLPGVVRLKNDPDGYGRYVEIDHGNGTSTRYAHLSSFAVRDGQRVEQGATIAMSGGAQGSAGAGNSQGPHVHYEFLRDGQQVDPAGAVGRAATVQPGNGRPSGQAFATEDDVLEWAEEQSGGDWRLRAYYEKAGLSALSRRRGARADEESEAARQADEWRAANPGADWTSAPASIRSSVSPSYRASMAERQQSEAEADQKDDLTASRNTTYLALKDEAAAAPAAFMSRDIESYRGTLTEGQYADLREDRRRLATQPAAGQPTINQQISSISQVVTTYARQSGIETRPAQMKPEEAQQLASVNQYLSDFARTYQASAGRPPSQEELVGALRVAIIPVRNTDGDRVPLASVAGQRGTQIEVPSGPRRDITRRLQAEGVRNPTRAQIASAYRILVQRGELEPPRNQF